MKKVFVTLVLAAVGMVAVMTWAQDTSTVSVGEALKKGDAAYKKYMKGLNGLENKDVLGGQAAKEKQKAIDQSKAEAEKWYRIAAESGNAKGEYYLGNLLLSDVSIDNSNTNDPTLVEAVQWFQKAADKGYAAAETQLGIFYEDGIELPGGKDLEKAQFWYQKAADKGDKTAKGFLKNLKNGVSNF